MTPEKYFHIEATRHLLSSGIIDALKTKHLSALRRFRVEADYGQWQVRKCSSGGLESVWTPYIEALVAQLAKWPVKAEFHGLNLIPWLEPVLEQFLGYPEHTTYFKQVPHAYMEMPFLAKLVSCNRDLFDYIPLALHGQDLFEEMCKVNGSLLAIIPRVAVNRQLCELAVANDPRAICYVPQALVTDKLVSDVLTKDGMALEMFNIKTLSERHLIIAVRASRESVRFIPEHLRTERIKRLAMAPVERSGGGISVHGLSR